MTAAVAPGAAPAPRPARSRVLDAVGRAGSLVTLTALMVLGAAAACLVDDVPPAGGATGATVDATFHGAGR